MSKGKYVVSGVPRITCPRNQFDLSHRVLTSGSVGYLYPFEVQEILPGDTFKIKTTVVTRVASALIKPIMDNLFIDIYYFFVPNRIVHKNWAKVFGESTSAWTPNLTYYAPMLYTPNGVDGVLSTNQIGGNRQVGACMGLPLGVPIVCRNDSAGVLESVSSLPFRGFAKIYNEFFRDENLINETYVYDSDSTANEVLNTNAWSPNNYTGKVPKIAKFRDYFTGCLPAPQKGSPVNLALNAGWLPVSARTITHTLPSDISGEKFLKISGTSVPGTSYYRRVSTVDGSSGSSSFSSSSASIEDGLVFAVNNLWADGSSIGSFTVNDFRTAFQLQRLLEKDARSGTRLVEQLISKWGVNPGDNTLQRPEFLGGKRIPISVTQVTQTSAPLVDDDPYTLGQVGAFSLSNGQTRFVKSFTESGFIIGVFALRQFHSYQQSLERFWRRVKRLDFYDPTFQSIGEQPVLKSELCATGTNVVSREVFGYQEAWAEYRRRPNIITGQMNSNCQNALDMWHLGDYYVDANNLPDPPTLGQQFIEETDAYMNRVVSVESTEMDQFIVDFWLDSKAVRPLPLYSVPGLIDHH